MDFALLGRLRPRTGSGVVGLPGPVSRSIVARLLLARGGVVQRDTLIDELWGEREARNPANALQVQITELRAAFAAQGEEGCLESPHGGHRTPRRGGRAPTPYDRPSHVVSGGSPGRSPALRLSASVPCGRGRTGRGPAAPRPGRRRVRRWRDRT
ncbi:AfsR/SARP family transcriptional regulator [Streptomyces microflavus]|uniref:AfsR/SARP family transcriptional regulator n=1 Tax=Streptomyces microflavus TaxID=1919 RepID=UPI0036C67117